MKTSSSSNGAKIESMSTLPSSEHRQSKSFLIGSSVSVWASSVHSSLLSERVVPISFSF